MLGSALRLLKVLLRREPFILLCFHAATEFWTFLGIKDKALCITYDVAEARADLHCMCRDGEVKLPSFEDLAKWLR